MCVHILLPAGFNKGGSGGCLYPRICQESHPPHRKTRRTHGTQGSARLAATLPFSSPSATPAPPSFFLTLPRILPSPFLVSVPAPFLSLPLHLGCPLPFPLPFLASFLSTPPHPTPCLLIRLTCLYYRGRACTTYLRPRLWGYSDSLTAHHCQRITASASRVAIRAISSIALLAAAFPFNTFRMPCATCYLAAHASVY